MLDVNKLVKTSFRGISLYMPPQYKELHRTMGYEKLTLDIFSRLLKPGSVFVDVGAHVGMFTVLGSKKVGPKGEVFSFDPIPENVKALKKNLELNSLSNVKVTNQALSSSSGDKVFKIREDTGLSGFYEHPLGATVKEINVRAATLDEHFKDKKVDFIKIDTEGHEMKVLEGAKETLKNNPHAQLIIELNPSSLKSAGKTPEDLLEFILSLGYEVYSIDDQLNRFYRLTDKHKQWKDNFPQYGYTNLLCIPKGTSKSMLFFSHTNNINGAERSIVEISKSLQEQGVLVAVVKPPGGQLTKLLDEAGIASIDAPTTWWFYSPSNKRLPSTTAVLEAGVPILEQYLKIVEELDYDFVATNTSVQPWSAATAKLLSKPHLWFAHEFIETLRSPFQGAQIMQYITDSSVRVIAVSKSLKENLSKFINSEKIEVLYSPVELKVTKAVDRYYKDKSALHLISLGSVNPNKRQLDVVKAVHKLTQNGHKAELIIAGEATDKEYLTKISSYIDKHSLRDKVHILDQVEEAYPLLAESDVVVVSSEKETFGRTVVEGMLASKVVVATKSGGPEEIITSGQNGFLYNPGKLEELIKILTETATNQALNKQISKNANQSIREILAQNPVDKLAEFLKQYNKTSEPLAVMDSILEVLAKDSASLRASHEEAQKVLREAEQYHSSVRELEETVRQKDALIHNIYSSKRWRLASKLASPLDKLKRKARD